MIGRLQTISRAGCLCRPLVARPAFAAPRALQTSARRLASEVPSDPLQDPEFRSFFEKVRAHQPALDAMMKIGKIMQEKGQCQESVKYGTESRSTGVSGQTEH